MARGVKTISVVGLGYIGLPTAAMFASAGVEVVGVDVNPEVVAAVNSGRAHIEEGSLDALVASAVSSGRLHAQSVPGPADAFIITVPTPLLRGTEGNGACADLSFVEAAGHAIAAVLKRGDLVILESTSPVGTTAMLSRLFATTRPDLSFPHDAGEKADVAIAYCPERIIPGRMLEELVMNDRIVGGLTPACTRKASALYELFVKGECIRSDDRTAEMVKLTENAFRDVNIAFANELSMICGDMQLDVWDVIGLANRHPRVSILNPGPGVGGHCIAVDPWFIVAGAPEKARLIRTGREVNDAKQDYVLSKVSGVLRADANARAVCLGLAYKPDVGDFRESPSLEISRALSLRFPGRVTCCDPFAASLPVDQATGIELGDPVTAIADADVIVALVAHSAFRSLKKPGNAVVLDTVGFWR
jgi:UDP-N-acetyl-D-mannosaminuronic acid dehydrogenase